MCSKRSVPGAMRLDTSRAYLVPTVGEGLPKEEYGVPNLKMDIHGTAVPSECRFSCIRLQFVTRTFLMMPI